MKKNINTNYLDRIPAKNESINWSKDESGAVTLEIENKGVMNRIAQKLFKKPKISYIHLDETGSFVWPIIDGKKNIAEIGTELEDEFGEKAHPLYERLAKYFQILESYGFVKWTDKE
ncbi:MAG: PqqD family protein [Ruminococcaceae bacterium]|nr:PqqD family protein [Oscillospiraceae bacterium]